jgi:hypothetical protein
MIGLQINPTDIQKIVSTNNTTQEGLLLGGILVLLFAVGYLFLELQKLHKEYSIKLESFNDSIIKINNQYSDSIRSLVEFNKK